MLGVIFVLKCFVSNRKKIRPPGTGRSISVSPVLLKFIESNDEIVGIFTQETGRAFYIYSRPHRRMNIVCVKEAVATSGFSQYSPRNPIAHLQKKVFLSRKLLLPPPLSKWATHHTTSVEVPVGFISKVYRQALLRSSSMKEKFVRY